jgi:hypothetical protein
MAASFARGRMSSVMASRPGGRGRGGISVPQPAEEGRGSTGQGAG